MWVIVALAFVIMIALLFIILICFLRSNEKRLHLKEKDIHLLEERLHLMEKRREGQEIVIERMWEHIIELVEGYRLIRVTLRHYHMDSPLR